MRKLTRGLVALLLCGAVSVNADVVRTRGGGSGSGIAPGTVFVGQIVAPAADNCTSPPYSFSGDLNTGVCSSAADTVNLQTGGTNRITLSSTTETHTLPVSLATTGCGGATSSLAFGDADSGICNAGPAATNVGIQVNGSELFRCSTGSACQFSSTFLTMTSGNIVSTPGALTASTMTVENSSQMRTVTHSYTWTNAQVVALGATTTGNINVATLPAKTQVLDAMVVITGQGAGTTTLTVSCGDAIAGTPFINYVVASSAQAAANTVYGDALAERGTSLDTEFFYLPSYTATTLVTCQFISTGANLSAVTGSTGRVILTTRLLP